MSNLLFKKYAIKNEIKHLKKCSIIFLLEKYLYTFLFSFNKNQKRQYINMVIRIKFKSCLIDIKFKPVSNFLNNKIEIIIENRSVKIMKDFFKKICIHLTKVQLKIKSDTNKRLCKIIS